MAEISFPRAGIIGLGAMGNPMAKHILKRAKQHGSTVTVTARHPERATSIVEAGAQWADTPAELVANCDVVLLMLPDLPEVDEVLSGTTGLLVGLVGLEGRDGRPGNPVVLGIGSTSSPDGVRELGAQLNDATSSRLRVVDCPVSGGEDGAVQGTLSIMVGGDDNDVARIRPVLEACGNPVHLGPLGAGQVAKACNQMIVAATIMALGEASVIAERAGIDLRTMFTLLQGGYAGSRVLDSRLERLITRDYSPSGIAKYMVKDLSFALQEAKKSTTVVRQTEVLLRQFQALTEAGFGENDMAVTRAFVEQLRP